MNYGEVYGKMHRRGAKVFSGYSIKPSVGDIAALVREFDFCAENARLLDYGSGKGYQYLALRVHEEWGNILPICYDPGVRQLSERPFGFFHGIICTDVMEHIEEADVPGVLADIFSFAKVPGFVFFYIACRPAKRKKLPDGRDVHVTIRPPEWWNEQLEPFRRDGLVLEVSYDGTGV